MKKLNYFNWRFLLIIIFLIIAVLAIFIRVIYLQVDKENFLKDWGQNQHIAFRTSAPVRGTIYDRNNVPLAITLTHFAFIFGSPNRNIKFCFRQSKQTRSYICV